MTKERWDALSIQDRAVLLRRSDPSMRDARWQPLINRMSNSRFDELTAVQQDAVREIA